jgi:hypothetical protein
MQLPTAVSPAPLELTWLLQQKVTQLPQQQQQQQQQQLQQEPPCNL